MTWLVPTYIVPTLLGLQICDYWELPKLSVIAALCNRNPPRTLPLPVTIVWRGLLYWLRRAAGVVHQFSSS
jgi:hypothetical protein